MLTGCEGLEGGCVCTSWLWLDWGVDVGFETYNGVGEWAGVGWGCCEGWDGELYMLTASTSDLQRSDDVAINWIATTLNVG